MAFGGAYTQDPNARTSTGLGSADALLGLPISGQIRYLTGTRGFRRTELGFYVQDIYKATEKLTLTLGLRYEDFVGWPWTEVADRMYQFVPAKQDVVRVGTEGIPRSGVHQDKNNLSPRVGLAYRFLPKTVVRAAYGMYYSAPQWDITRNLAANPPQFVVSSFANDQFNAAGAWTVQQGFSRPQLGSVEGALRAIDIDARTPYTQQWNVAIQQELPSSLSLTVAYVGTKGTKLQGYTNTNQPVPRRRCTCSAPAFPQVRHDLHNTESFRLVVSRPAGNGGAPVLCRTRIPACLYLQPRDRCDFAVRRSHGHSQHSPGSGQLRH